MDLDKYLLLKYMKIHNHSATIFSPISLIALTLFATMYIDYTDFFLFNNGYEDTPTIVTRAKHLLSLWHMALRISGGDLKLTKSSWTLLIYT